MIFKDMKQFLLITLIICVSACQTTQEKPDYSRIKKESEDMLKAFHEAVNASGIIAEFDFLDSSSSFYWTPPGYSYAIEYDSIKTILLETHNTLLSAHFKWDTLDVFPLTETYSNYRGVVSCQMTGADSSEQSFKVLESGTLVKRADGWKFLSGQSRVQ